MKYAIWFGIIWDTHLLHTYLLLHPEHSKSSPLHWCVQSSTKAQSQNHPCVRRVNNPIIPQPGLEKKMIKFYSSYNLALFHIELCQQCCYTVCVTTSPFVFQYNTNVLATARTVLPHVKLLPGTGEVWTTLLFKSLTIGSFMAASCSAVNW